MKTPKEITADILSSLRIPNAPERILIEAYLESVIKQHCKMAILDASTKQIEEVRILKKYIKEVWDYEGTGWMNIVNLTPEEKEYVDSI